MTKREFINKYIYGIDKDALTYNQEAIDMSNDLDKYVTEQLRQYNVVGRSEQLKAYAEYLQTRPDFQERSNKDLAIDYCDSL